MTDRETIKTLIVGAYAARDRGDIEALMSVFHSGAIFELKGQKATLEVAVMVSGRPAVQASLGRFVDAFKFDNRKIVSFIIDGEHAAVHSSFDVTFKPKNKTFTTEVLDLFRFADGKIVELLEFADTALIKELIS
jgi:ketosteroid isomerase-like protein